MVLGPLHVVLQVPHVRGARECPERERVASRHRRLRVVDRLVRTVKREAAARAQQTIEPELEPRAEPLLELAERRAAEVVTQPATEEGRQEAPAEASGIRQPFVLQLGAAVA